MGNVWMMTLASGISHLVHFGLMVTLIVIAAVVIRRHRPDAWLGFVIAGVVEIIGAGIQTVLLSIGPAMISARGGSIGGEAYGPFYGAMTLFGSCITVVFWVLVLLGLVKLARRTGSDSGS